MIWFVLIVLAGLAIWPFYRESSRPQIDHTARKGVLGKFAELGQGDTYYRWYGPVRGPVIVAIHGLTTPSAVWNVVAPGLGALGYRVLTYDLYGRGMSDGPKGAQNAAFFSRQLHELLEDQGLTDDVTLLGHSMGGSIASAYAAAHPHQVSRLILVATAGVETVESRFSAFCRKVPILGDWAFMMFAGRRHRRDVSAQQATSEVPDIVQIQTDELNRQGFLPAVLSSRRGMLAESQEEAHKQISRADIPVIAIWGARDTVIPLSALGRLAQWNRIAKQEVIDDAGHGLLYTHGSAVVAALRLVLSEK